ncbi:MAG: hypothetical protein QOD63_2799, partial [Actinomycetota bacterium]|nr:hypothetical protein [Actinomycetota bacterium]
DPVTARYVPVLRDAGTQNSVPYLVMDYVPGDTLLHEAPVEHDRLVAVALWLAQALAACHHLRVAHNDVKPGNVVLTDDGVRLIDFGLATAPGCANLPGRDEGTPGFMAPERLARRGGNEASDVFAWGCTIAYAATGQLPFPGTDRIDLIRRTAEDPAVLDGIGPPLRSVLEASLQKVPGDRPSAAQLVESLGGRPPGPPALRPPEPGPRDPLPGPTTPDSRRPRWIATGCAVLLLAGVVALAVSRRDRPEAGTGPATTMSTRTSPTLSHPTFPRPTTTVPAGAVGSVGTIRAPGESEIVGLTWDGSSFWFAEKRTLFRTDIGGHLQGTAYSLSDAFSPPYTLVSELDGLTWDGSTFVVAGYHFNGPTIEYQLSRFTVDGERVNLGPSFPSPPGTNTTAAHSHLAWDGTNIWFVGAHNVYAVDGSGAHVHQFPTSSQVVGIAWDGSHLWIAYNRSSPILQTYFERVDEKGDTLAGPFLSPVQQVMGLVWADGALWALDGSGERLLHRLDMTMLR